MRLEILLEFLVQVFFAWTVAYETVLCLRLPARDAQFLALALLVPFVLFSVRRWSSVLARPVRKPWFSLGVLALVLVCGGSQLFVGIFDCDDYSALHRVLWQQEHPDRPYALHDTMHGDESLPALSVLHVATSYEPLVGIVAQDLGLDTLWVFQSAGAALAGGLLPVVLVLLYRRFRLSDAVSLAATVAALAFLMTDGGNWPVGAKAFGRLLAWTWPAKNILWLVGMPLAFLWGMRFLARPTLARYVLLVMLAASGVGLSNSGVYLVPAFWFILSVAYGLGFGFTRRRLRRMMVLNTASFPCVAVAALLMSGVIPEPADRSVWLTDWPGQWWLNLQIATGDWPRVVRDLVVLLAVAPAALNRPLRRLPVLLTLTTAVIFFNPLVGPVWMKFLLGTYWRLVYVIPLPWAAGLAAGCLRIRGIPPRYAAVRLGALVAAVVVTVLAYDKSALSGMEFKEVGGYKFRAREMDFVRLRGASLDGRLVLASETLMPVVALQHPRTRAFVGMHRETPHMFANAHRADEGNARLDAKRFVMGEISPTTTAAFREALAHGVDAVVVLDGMQPLVRRLLRDQGNGSWHEDEAVFGYALFLRNP